MWQHLSVKARRAFTELHANEGIPISSLDGQEQFLAESGYVEIHAKGSQVRLAKPCDGFRRAIRAMARHDLMARSDADAMSNYLREHFTGEELAGMGQSLRYGYGSERLLVPEVTSVGWVEAFLANNSIPRPNRRLEQNEMSRWVNLHRPDDQPVVDPNVAKRLVRHLMELPAPVAFAELPDRWPDVPTSALRCGDLRRHRTSRAVSDNAAEGHDPDAGALADDLPAFALPEAKAAKADEAENGFFTGRSSSRI